MGADRGSGTGIRSADWLTRLSSRSVSPAAGSAAALTGAMGVALLIKLAQRTRPERVLNLDQTLDRLLTARDRLAVIAESDAWAITTWLLTRGTQEGDSRRQAALQRLIGVPLEAAELCHSVRLEAQPLLEAGHPPTVSDAQAGIRLIETSQEILCALVETDLALVTDRALASTIEGRLERLSRCPPEIVIR